VHPLEGIIIIAAGTIGWLVGSGWFPADPHRRRDLEVRLPWVRNRKLMYASAILLWVFGLLVFLGVVK
jgi:hypothetical protein